MGEQRFFFIVHLCSKHTGALHYKTHRCVLHWTHEPICVQLLHTVYSINWHTNRNKAFYILYALVRLYILCTAILRKNRCWYNFLRKQGMTKQKTHRRMLLNVHHITWNFKDFKNVVTAFPVKKFMVSLLHLTTWCWLILQCTDVFMLFKATVCMLSFTMTMFFAIVSSVQ